MSSTQRAVRLLVVVLTVMAVAAVPAVPAGADHVAPPGPVLGGTGSLQGTELVEDQFFTGQPCFVVTRHVFGLRGVGTYSGWGATGERVVYRAEVGEGGYLYRDGPLRVEVENDGTYYHGPLGTHGGDPACSAATSKTAIPAQFRIFAPDHVYRLDASGAQVPCLGHGSYARGNMAEAQNWQADWTMNEDCVVVGNAAGTPGTGVAPVGTGHTHHGTHGPCGGSCLDNFKVDYAQYLPVNGPYLALSGPSSSPTGKALIVVARVSDGPAPVPDILVTFSVAGPGPAAPPGGTGITGADGGARFTFTASVLGDYTVSASAVYSGQVLTATHAVRIVAPEPLAVRLTGQPRGQTGDAQTVTATATDEGAAATGAAVQFSVAGPGQESPALGAGVTDDKGRASFTFSADRAGSYEVTATATHAEEQASASHTVRLDVRTLSRQDALTYAFGEDLTHAAVIDPAGRYGYLVVEGQQLGVEDQLVKVDLQSFQRVGTLAIAAARSVVIDPAGRYAYVGNSVSLSPGQVVKVDLATFQQVGALTLAQGEDRLTSAVMDPGGRYAYFGASPRDSRPNVFAPGKVVKIDLATFERLGAATFPEGELGATSGVIDNLGRYAYFAAQGANRASLLVKVDLASMQRVGAIVFDDYEGITSAVVDPDGSFAYVATTNGNAIAPPARVRKIDLHTFQRVASITLAEGEVAPTTALMDPGGRSAYFGAYGGYNAGARVVRVDLDPFERAYATTPVSGDKDFVAGFIDPDGSHAYFGTDGSSVATPPDFAELVRVALTRPPNPALEAGHDGPAGYGTPYATPLSKAAPGVLANDRDTADDDPLVAGQASDPAGGRVSLNPDGSFTYTPDAGFSGTDTFTYTASDGIDYSAPATVSITVEPPPAGVATVAGGACAYSTNVSLFGGPQTLRGCGQTESSPATSEQQASSSPSVTLPATGTAQPNTATKTEGAVAQYGPAVLFGGIWPADVSAPPPSGPLTATTQGTTGPDGSANSSAGVSLHNPPPPVRCEGQPAGTTNCTAPGGVGPGPVVAAEARSTCTADQSGLTGSSTFVDGVLETKTDDSGEVIASEPIPTNPPPNYIRSGTIDHVGDSYRVVFNEQILGPDSITVNAVHMYLLGATAVGDMIIGQSRCAVEAAAPNAAPVAADDAFSATAGQALTVPAGGVLANDTDTDGQPLSAGTLAATAPPASGGGNWTFPSDPANGKLRLGHDGGFTYTPNPGFTGVDTFTYLAQDARGKADSGTVTMTVAAPVARLVVADFNGNGTSDVSVFRPGTGTWHVRNQPSVTFGTQPGDVPVPADYDGNGTTDVAVFRSGTWHVRNQPAVTYGTQPGDVPVPGDYDGDGDADIAVYRPSTGTWHIRGQAAVTHGTQAGDVPVLGDYDGDGDADIAVFRPSTGTWFVRGQAAVTYGTQAGDVPVPADYNGDRSIDIAVYRPSTGTWFVRNQLSAVHGTQAGDVPVVGDYDGDGTADIAVYRPSSGTWFIRNHPSLVFGTTTGDLPLPMPFAIRRAYYPAP